MLQTLVFAVNTSGLNGPRSSPVLTSTVEEVWLPIRTAYGLLRVGYSEAECGPWAQSENFCGRVLGSVIITRKSSLKRTVVLFYHIEQVWVKLKTLEILTIGVFVSTHSPSLYTNVSSMSALCSTYIYLAVGAADRKPVVPSSVFILKSEFTGSCDVLWALRQRFLF